MCRGVTKKWKASSISTKSSISISRRSVAPLVPMRPRTRVFSTRSEPCFRKPKRQRFAATSRDVFHSTLKVAVANRVKATARSKSKCIFFPMSMCRAKYARARATTETRWTFSGRARASRMCWICRAKPRWSCSQTNRRLRGSCRRSSTSALAMYAWASRRQRCRVAKLSE